MTLKKILYILVLAALTSCQSSYQKMLKSSDSDQQYDAAMKYYEEGVYFKAYSLFEKLIPVYRLTERAETINFLIAKCYYEETDYLMAAYYFDRFIVTFPNSDSKEEAYYFKALCYYYNSPKPSLDQTYTLEAIQAFQAYVNKFSNGKYVQESNQYVAELREKLELKAFEKAKLYYTLEDHKAAVVVLKNCLKEYPDTKYREEILFMSLRSAFLLAEKSVEEKKRERYDAAVEDYYTYIDEYPQGIWIKDAEKIFAQISKRNQVSDTN